MQRHSRFQVLHLLAESIRQSRQESNQAEGSQSGSLSRSLLDLWRGANLHSAFLFNWKPAPVLSGQDSHLNNTNGMVRPPPLPSQQVGYKDWTEEASHRTTHTNRH
jgi:hypothetical protein